MEYGSRTCVENSQTNETTGEVFTYSFEFADYTGKKLEVGKVYDVTYEGNTYSCVCREYTNTEKSINGYFLGELDYLLRMNTITDETVKKTGEPFLIQFTADQTIFMAVLIDITATHYNLGFARAREIKTLDEKYLPDTVATKTYVDNAISNIEIPEGGSGASVSTEIEVFGERAVEFQTDSSLGGLYSKGFYEAEGDIVFQLIEGETYFVEWDGETYERVAAAGTLRTANGFYVGNLSIAGLGDDTGEPFIVAYAVNDETAFNALISNDTEASHTVRVYQKAPLQVSWDNITNKPFSESSEVIEALPLQDITFTWNADNNQWDQNAVFTTIPDELVVGVTCTVTYNETVYEVVAADFMSMAIVLGNQSAMGTGADTGEPFLIAVDKTGAVSGEAPGFFFMCLEDAPTDGTTTITRSIGIDASVVTIKHLDPKFIKDMYYDNTTEEVMFPESTIPFTLDSNMWMFNASSAGLPAPEVGQSYKVIWDGVEYYATGKVYVMENTMFVYYVGNLGRIYAGIDSTLEDTGEPFLFAHMINNSNGATQTMFADLETPTTETSNIKTVSLYKIVQDIHQIDNKYLSILEPTNATTIIQEQTVNTAGQMDTGFLYLLNADTSIFTAYNEQTVYVNYNGVVYKCSVVSLPNYAYIGNGYIIDSAVEDTGEPFCIWLNNPTVLLSTLTGETVTIKVSDKSSDYAIKGEYLSGSGGSGFGLPEVKDEDEGKFLRIVNGEAVWSSVSNAEEVRF